MFAERLQRVADRIQGTLALSLIAGDGIPVASQINDHDLDLEVLAAELMAQVKAIGSDQRELGVGDVRHFAVATDSRLLMITDVGANYYLMLIAGADTHPGRARFELRRAVLLFEDDLI